MHDGSRGRGDVQVRGHYTMCGLEAQSTRGLLFRQHCRPGWISRRAGEGRSDRRDDLGTVLPGGGDGDQTKTPPGPGAAPVEGVQPSAALVVYCARDGACGVFRGPARSRGVGQSRSQIGSRRGQTDLWSPSPNAPIQCRPTSGTPGAAAACQAASAATAPAAGCQAACAASMMGQLLSHCNRRDFILY